MDQATIDDFTRYVIGLVRAGAKPSIRKIRDDVEALLTNPADGNGRPEIEQYIVGRCNPLDTAMSWDNRDPRINKARRDYEAGLVDLCTGRDGKTLILYAIPRRRVTPRPGYFHTRRDRADPMIVGGQELWG